MRRRAFELPPLELLVAFESAARHLSFTRAADEIALTQSAVSRQIQALEASLGVELFRRLHRALALTEAGHLFHRATAAALADLAAATQSVKRDAELKTVVVTTTAGFAGLWLIPRLSGFVAANPGVDVRISTSNALAQLDRDGVDVAVRYQAVDPAPPGSVQLFGETVYPVCSPKLRRDAGAALRVPADLSGQTLLRMEPDGKNQLQDWGLWLHALGLADLRPAGVLHFSSYDQLIQAAVAGQGIALARLPLIDRLIKARKLVAPFNDAVVSPRGYCMIVAARAARKTEVLAFASWLTATARAPDSAGRRGRARA
ncbi:MAG: LysR substrate-binding domain-containing protein [Pseudomonadota bacterium]|nr:LysR substrate-binding domain-containing protein [Pseudomonadota bacterium]